MRSHDKVGRLVGQQEQLPERIAREIVNLFTIILDLLAQNHGVQLPRLRSLLSVPLSFAFTFRIWASLTLEHLKFLLLCSQILQGANEQLHVPFEEDLILSVK